MAKKKAAEVPAVPAKRGRKPGSKNKASASAVAAAQAAGSSVASVPASLTQEQMQKAGRIYELQQQIAAQAKPLLDEEIKLRKELAAEIVPAGHEGAISLPLGGGWELSIDAGLSRKLDDRQFTSVFGRLPQGTAEKVLHWKAELAVGEYRALPDDQRAILDECVTATPKAPTITIKPPKPATME